MERQPSGRLKPNRRFSRICRRAPIMSGGRQQRRGADVEAYRAVLPEPEADDALSAGAEEARMKNGVDN